MKNFTNIGEKEAVRKKNEAAKKPIALSKEKKEIDEEPKEIIRNFKIDEPKEENAEETINFEDSE